MKNNRLGKIDISALNVPPEKHEYETAKYFAKRGLDVSFIEPSNIQGTNSPDFEMCGKRWETKSPIGSNLRTYEDLFKKALKQSENIIFDLRRLKPSDEERCFNRLQYLRKVSKAKNLLIITRDGRLLTIKGRFAKM